MYANETPSPQFFEFDPRATIVIADRMMDSFSDEYGKPTLMTAEEISGKLRSGWVNQNAFSNEHQTILTICNAVRQAAQDPEDVDVSEFIQELADILKINLTRRVRVELSMQVTAIVDLPFDEDINDICSSDFGINGVEYSGEGDLYDWEMEDTELVSADFDE